jgi:hypothetical protein
MTIYVYTYITSPLDQFKLLIFRLGLDSVIVNNEEVIFICLFILPFLFLSLKYLFKFLINKSLINEGYFIFNLTGESSSQGSSQHNINSGGEGSSNNPNPNRNPADPGPGPQFNWHPSWLNTVMIKIKDTDQFADYLEIHKDKTLGKANIGFDSAPSRLLERDKNVYFSKIARGIKKHHPEWFHCSWNRGHLTIVDNDFINKIRTLHKDIRDLK